MCTVIFVPTAKGNLFASCRDEDPLRQVPGPPACIKGFSGHMLYPVDKAGGTWAGMHELGHVIILLNGALNDHKRENSYRMSRGLVVQQLLDDTDPLYKWAAIDLENIQPFTLVLFFKNQLYEMRWDGTGKTTEIKDKAVPHIWSSSTLYNEEAKQMRRKWFENGISNVSSIDELYRFLYVHRQKENGFIMKRSAAMQTLSVSLLHHYNNAACYVYYDVLQMHRSNVSLKLKLQKQEYAARS